MAKKDVAKGAKTIKAASVPDGYEVIERPPFWDADKNPIINGRRGETEEFEFTRGEHRGKVMRSFVLQDEEIGAVTVRETSMLRQMFDSTKAGDVVRIEYLGEIPPKYKDDSPTKNFSCAVKRAGRKSNAPF